MAKILHLAAAVLAGLWVLWPLSDEPRYEDHDFLGDPEGAGAGA